MKGFHKALIVGGLAGLLTYIGACVVIYHRDGPGLRWWWLRDGIKVQQTAWSTAATWPEILDRAFMPAGLVYLIVFTATLYVMRRREG